MLAIEKLKKFYLLIAPDDTMRLGGMDDACTPPGPPLTSDDEMSTPPSASPVSSNFTLSSVSDCGSACLSAEKAPTTFNQAAGSTLNPDSTMPPILSGSEDNQEPLHEGKEVGEEGNLLYQTTKFEEYPENRNIWTKSEPRYRLTEAVSYTLLEGTYLSSEITAERKLALSSPRYLPQSWTSQRDAEEDITHMSDEEEANVVLINELVEIRSISLAGSGFFARQDLEFGDVVLMESLIMPPGTGGDLKEQFANLDALAQRVFLCLHNHTLRGYKPDLSGVLSSIYDTNTFSIPGGLGVLPVASRFNHRCHEKCDLTYAWDKERQLMVFTVKADFVPAGAELTISYGGPPEHLLKRYGFICECGGCSGMTAEKAEEVNSQFWP